MTTASQHLPANTSTIQEAATENDLGTSDTFQKILISCENVHKTYLLGIEGVVALRGVSLDVYTGEFVVIYGTSGGGKTSMLNILGTIDTATKGNVLLMGKRVAQSTPDSDLAKLRLESMGFVFQSFNLLSTMSAQENVELPMILLGKLTADERTKRAKELLEMVGLGHRLDHLPSQLSGGEQQRATIARALANDPRVLFMDEPTGDLDTKNSKKIMDIMLRLNIDRRITIVMVTHDPQMKQYAHRAVYMRDGKLQRIEAVPAAERSRAVDILRDEAARLEKAVANVDRNPGAVVTERRSKTAYGAISSAMRSAAALRDGINEGSTNPFMNTDMIARLFGASAAEHAARISVAESAMDREMERRVRERSELPPRPDSRTGRASGDSLGTPGTGPTANGSNAITEESPVPSSTE